MHIIIIGSGIAALACMKQLSPDIQVTCLTQNRRTDNNSYKAQGGICFSKYEHDGGHGHCEDTFQTGEALGDRSVIQSFITQSDRIIQQLIDEGLPFDRDAEAQLAFALEGAHHHPRILHAQGDQTGRVIMQHLTDALSDTQHTFYENMEVIDILKNEQNEACGVVALDDQDILHHFEGDAVICATGGVSQLFTPNSNQNLALSTGAILAFHHNIPLQNMEMIQFHPTLLGTTQKTYGLVSEAVRGAGATFVNSNGDAFMDHVHPLKSLAPRDITSRMIFQQQLQGQQCYLDISTVPDFQQRFPTISRAVRQYDETLFDTHRLPVTLGAHYTIGGIAADISGQTALPRFFAIGEAACTHFHGANRLASNSLLEGLVMGVNCANTIQQHMTPVVKTPCKTPLTLPNVNIDVTQTLQQESFGVLGVERDGTDMTRFKAQLDRELYHAPTTTHVTQTRWQHYCTLKLLQIITSAALTRQESRGVHYRRDYPNMYPNELHLITETYNGGNQHVKSIAYERETKTILH